LSRASRRPWGDDGKAFCQWLVVVNLCDAPSTYTLELSGVASSSSIDHASHEFDQVYNTTLEEKKGEGSLELLLLSDVVEGYGNSVFRLGCDGWM
jgi:hypothetical protein